MAAAWDDDTAVSLAKGTLFKRAVLYIPALGMPGGGDSLGIPANAPHKAAAMLFVAYLIRPEVQKKLNATIGSYLARTDVSGENALIPEEQRQKFGTAMAAGRLQGPLHPAVRLRSAAEIGLALADAARRIRRSSQQERMRWSRPTGVKRFWNLPGRGASSRVDEIARQFNVSRETVRRDLSYLHSHGLLRRVHGGAMPAQTGWEAAFPQRLVANAAAKRRIAALAASLFRKNDTLMIDTGTTTLMLSAALAAAPKLSVITNSFGIARELGTATAQHKVYVVGGEYPPRDGADAGLGVSRADRALPCRSRGTELRRDRTERRHHGFRPGGCDVRARHDRPGRECHASLSTTRNSIAWRWRRSAISA